MLERVAEDAERREVKEALRREEEGERLEVQRLAAERQIEALDRMEAKRLEVELWQEDELRRPYFETMEEG